MTAEPNVVPMIDILLVLLIIFMLTALPDRKLISAQLPPETTTTSGDTESIVLEVGPGGRYALNRAPVPHGALHSRLREIYAARPTKTIFIRGNPRATYQEVLTAMDVARGADVRVIGLLTSR